MASFSILPSPVSLSNVRCFFPLVPAKWMVCLVPLWQSCGNLEQGLSVVNLKSGKSLDNSEARSRYGLNLLTETLNLI